MTKIWALSLALLGVFGGGMRGQELRRPASVDSLFEAGEYAAVVEDYEGRSVDSSAEESVWHRTFLAAKSYFYLGRTDASIALFDRIPTQRLSNLRLAFRVVLEHALALLDAGQLDRARERLAWCSQRLETVHDSLLIARWHNYRAVLLTSVSEYDSALIHLDDALRGCGTSDDGLKMFVVANRGIVYRHLGQYDEALRCYMTVLEADRMRQRWSDVAADHLNIGNVFNEIGDTERASDHYGKALEHFRLTGDSAGAVGVLANMATVWMSKGEWIKAEHALREALDLAHMEGDRLSESNIRLNLGIVFQQTANHEEALIQFGRAGSLYALQGRLLETVELLAVTADSYLALGKLLLADSVLEAARQLIDAKGLDYRGFGIHYRRARLCERTGEDSLASFWYEQAVHELEQGRIWTGGTDAAGYYLEEDRGQTYRDYAAFLIRKGRPHEALQIYRQFKNRKFRERTISWRNAPVPGGDSTLVRLAFMLTDPVSYVFVHRDTILHAVPIAGRAAIESEAMALRSALAGPASLPWASASKRLYDLLLRDLQPMVRSAAALVIVPDGALHFVPFEALWDGRSFLVERCEVMYSITGDTPASSRFPTSGRAAIIAFDGSGPDNREYGPMVPLAYVQAERDSVAACLRPLLEVVSIDGEGDVRTAARDSLRIIHVAAHGLANPRRPGRSALRIAPADGAHDGFLTADEVEAAGLHADLVVLSACETSLGRLLRNEGMLGLTRAFLAAGSRQVVSTLWRVSDEGAGRFCSTFYRTWREAGETPASALRLTKLAMLKSGRYHPVQWSSMVLWLP